MTKGLLRSKLQIVLEGRREGETGLNEVVRHEQE